MAEPVLFPDAAGVAIEYLAAELAERGDSASVEPRIPVPRLDRFVTVRRSGGVKANIVQDGPLLIFEAWDAAGEEHANDLAQLCRALMQKAQGTVQSGVAIGHVTEVGGVVALPDARSDQPRYTFTLRVLMRGAPLEEVPQS